MEVGLFLFPGMQLRIQSGWQWKITGKASSQLITLNSIQGKTKHLKRDYFKGVFKKSLNRQESVTLGGEEGGVVLKMK